MKRGSPTLPRKPRPRRRPTRSSSGCKACACCYGVPLGHLVPDVRMLPNESLRFFALDARLARRAVRRRAEPPARGRRPTPRCAPRRSTPARDAADRDHRVPAAVGRGLAVADARGERVRRRRGAAETAALRPRPLLTCCSACTPGRCTRSALRTRRDAALRVRRQGDEPTELARSMATMSGASSASRRRADARAPGGRRQRSESARRAARAGDFTPAEFALARPGGRPRPLRERAGP